MSDVFGVIGRGDGKAVAQIFNLLYRGFLIRNGREKAERFGLAAPCRLQVGDTADYKSALR